MKEKEIKEIDKLISEIDATNEIWADRLREIKIQYEDKISSLEEEIAMIEAGEDW